MQRKRRPDSGQLTRQLSLIGWVSLLCLATLLLAGCEETIIQPPPASSNPSAAKAPAQATPDAPPEQPTSTGYQRPEYPGERRNPFVAEPSLVQPVQQQSSDGVEREREPLEYFALGALSLSVIISETAIPTAMFIDPTGFGHIVKEGDRIGLSQGVITGIRDNEVEVREMTSAGERMITIPLTETMLSLGQTSDGLSEQEREILERLLNSEQGRELLEQGRQNDSRQASQDSSPDPRFPGVAPPGRSTE